MKRLVLLAIVTGLGVWLGACDPTAEPADSGSTAATTPARDARPSIVSVTPQASRFVVAIGAAELLVAVDAASRALAGLETLPEASVETAPEFGAELILLDEPPDEVLVADLIGAGIEWFVYAPHDLEDALELTRTLGPRLVGEAETERFERAFSLPLAELAGSWFGERRPDVLAVVGFHPLTIAGGHSFETDLIEIAGGRSRTHPGEERRLVHGRDVLPALDAELVLIMTPQPPTAAQEQAVFEAMPGARAIEHFPFGDDQIWLGDAAGAARRLRARIATATTAAASQPGQSPSAP